MNVVLMGSFILYQPKCELLGADIRNMLFL